MQSLLSTLPNMYPANLGRNMYNECFELCLGGECKKTHDKFLDEDTSFGSMFEIEDIID
jgi:hypothetical protein